MTETTSPQVDGDSGDEGPERSSGRRGWVVPVIILVILLIGGGLTLVLTSPAAKTQAPEGVPIQNVPDLAPAGTGANGQPIDGMTCRSTMEQSDTYHVHAHVDIFVNGQQRRIPAGAGIKAPRFPEHLSTGLFVDNSYNSCLYWLHVHANDGIIHIEAPTKGNYTLGEFFDIWGQPLGPDQVGPAKGTVVAFENGKRFYGNPRDIPLNSQAVIQLDVGKPVVAFRPMTFKVTGLCGTGTQGCSISARSS